MAELIVLGSGTGIPSLRRASPGLYLSTGALNILVDSGPGIVRRMLEAGITYGDPDLLLYTHVHPDHVADFVPLLFASKYADSPRVRDLLCMGGPGFRHYVDQLKKIYGRWIEPQSYGLTIDEISEKPLVLQDVTIHSKPAAHMPESAAYRIELARGRSIVISGDTDYSPNIVDLARNTDLLVLECSFPEQKKVEGHLTPSLAGRIATESNCRKLLLVHLYPMCDAYDIAGQCASHFAGEIIVAEDLMRLTL
jgi:ribonuclease BN (tRNA processing enzyme)